MSFTTVHPHPLYLLPTSPGSGNRIWVCDRCNHRALGGTQYRCAQCDYDLCHKCFSAYVQHGVFVSVHSHPLFLIQKDNGWACDGRTEPSGCVKGCTAFNQTKGWKRYNCHSCNYDLCEGCEEKHIVQATAVKIHPHPLHKIVKDNGWACDGRKTPQGCAKGCTGFQQTWGWERYQCAACDFDLCAACVAEHSGPVLLKAVDNNSVEVNPPDNANTNNTEELNMCIVCMEKPKNASIIHGETGHQCTCFACAKALQQARQPCPICRAKIDAVIHNFMA